MSEMNEYTPELFELIDEDGNKKQFELIDAAEIDGEEYFAMIDPLYRSFGYAFQGIFTCVRKERNMKIHCVAAVLVVIAGVILKISAIEWCICMVLFGLVMALEHVNTAVEAVVDMVTEEYHPLAKVAKDTAAGAVLIAAIMAAIAGGIIFLPKIAQILQ